MLGGALKYFSLEKSHYWLQLGIELTNKLKCSLHPINFLEPHFLNTCSKNFLRSNGFYVHIYCFVQQTNNWEVNKLLNHTTIFHNVDVQPLGNEQIYNIHFNHKGYNVIIENYPACSCICFVIMMSTTFLGGCGAWVQC